MARMKGPSVFASLLMALAFLSCGGGGSESSPTLQPRGEPSGYLNVRNMDNIGSDGSYIAGYGTTSGDAMQIEVMASLSTLNSGQVYPSITSIKFDLDNDGVFEHIVDGKNRAIIDDIVRCPTPNIINDATFALRAQIAYIDPSYGPSIAYFSGQTITIKEASGQMTSYSPVQINNNILNNIDIVASISARFRNAGNDAYATQDQWKHIYQTGQSGVGIQITNYQIFYEFNEFRLQLSDQTQLINRTDNRKDLYDLVQAWLKNP